jgi:hypothetical protein
MSSQAVRSNRVQEEPGSLAGARPHRPNEPGDPLVRALAVCVRQAHARRVGRGRLDVAA